MPYNKELYSESAKTERFKRIAERRTNRILNNLRLLGNTANKQLYIYADNDVDKIFSVIDSKVSEIRIMFRKNKKDEFKL